MLSPEAVVIGYLVHIRGLHSARVGLKVRKLGQSALPVGGCSASEPDADIHLGAAPAHRWATKQPGTPDAITATSLFIKYRPSTSMPACCCCPSL